MSEQKKLRIRGLNTVGGVVSELGRVYREARRGDLDMADATRLASILREIRCALVSDDHDRRLDALEAAKTKRWGRKV